MKKRTILGLSEIVTVISEEGKKKIVSRIDTGATSSSIDLDLAEKMKLGPIINMRTVKSASGMKKRPIIKAKIDLNGSLLEAEFTLADRRHMTYQILIGQNILKAGSFLIDPLKK